MDMIYDVCYFCLFISGFIFFLGILGGAFELAYKYVPCFKSRVDKFIDVDDDDWESEV